MKNELTRNGKHVSKIMSEHMNGYTSKRM